MSGIVTPKGYLRVYHTPSGRHRLWHNVVWEEANGKIPDGFDIHHINHDKLDNRIDNLELITKLDHKREHSPHFRRNESGEWECQCGICQQWFRATTRHFYFNAQGHLAYGRCRPCHIAYTDDKAKQRKSRN